MPTIMERGEWKAEALLELCIQHEAKIERLRTALTEIAAPFDTGPTTVIEGLKKSALEFQRRWQIANEALKQ